MQHNLVEKICFVVRFKCKSLKKERGKKDRPMCSSSKGTFSPHNKGLRVRFWVQNALGVCVNLKIIKINDWV